MLRHFQLRPLLCALLLALSLPAFSQPQDTARRLILKDGSFQLVTKYEVKGDRVRYFSSEREEWEELPSSLVDWKATDAYERDRAATASSPEAVQLDKEIEHEREVQEAQLPEVSPGLRLPEDSGVFLLDNFQGEAQVVELQQIEGDINRDTRSNILRGAINPIAGQKQVIELDRLHASVQSHVEVPSIYLNVEEGPDQPQQPQSTQQSAGPEQPSVPFDRFRIVHLDLKGNKRILGDVKRQVTGKVTQEQHSVKTTITRVSGGWFKLTPAESLVPGEYAVVEMMGKEGMNLYVWDFGVNPKAAANANPWKAEAKGAKPADAPK